MGNGGKKSSVGELQDALDDAESVLLEKAQDVVLG